MRSTPGSSSSGSGEGASNRGGLGRGSFKVVQAGRIRGARRLLVVRPKSAKSVRPVPQVHNQTAHSLKTYNLRLCGCMWEKRSIPIAHRGPHRHAPGAGARKSRIPSAPGMTERGRVAAIQGISTAIYRSSHFEPAPVYCKECLRIAPGSSSLRVRAAPLDRSLVPAPGIFQTSPAFPPF